MKTVEWCGGEDRSSSGDNKRRGSERNNSEMNKRKGNENSRKSGMKSHRGNTMVEVTVSFAVLAVLAAIFSNIFFLSGRMAGQTEKKMEGDGLLFEQYYLGEDICREKAGDGPFVFYLVSRESKAEFFLLNQTAVYRYTDEEGGVRAIYDMGPDEDGE